MTKRQSEHCHQALTASVHGQACSACKQPTDVTRPRIPDSLLCAEDCSSQAERDIEEALCTCRCT